MWNEHYFSPHTSRTAKKQDPQPHPPAQAPPWGHQSFLRRVVPSHTSRDAPSTGGESNDPDQGSRHKQNP